MQMLPKDPTELDLGRMRNRVQIQRQAGGAPDSSGMPPEGWKLVRETWAGIDTASTREVFLANQYTSQVTHMVWLRWSPIPLAAQMRVLFGKRLFIVQLIENVRERNIRINLLCLEIDGVIS